MLSCSMLINYNSLFETIHNQAKPSKGKLFTPVLCIIFKVMTDKAHLRHTI